MSTTPRLRVRAGPSLSSLQPVSVNASPLAIHSASFEGAVSVRLRGYRGAEGENSGREEPKEGEELEEKGETWSVSFEGRFGAEGEEGEVGVDEILFGNVWRKPIRDYLPYGTAAALRFVKYVDPSLTCDLYADEPWALSPLFATLQRLSVRPHSSSSQLPSFSPTHGSFTEDVSPILPSSAAAPPPKDPAARRSYFASEENRRAAKPLSRELVVKGDFSHGFIDFSTLSLSLPGGLKFSLGKYWNGEPVVFSCRRRGTGEEFFVVTFELVGEEVKPPAKEAQEEKNEDVD
ncbi:hypothetical protein JCM10213_006133 [Rhodosporidiobolus nylandii]